MKAAVRKPRDRGKIGVIATVLLLFFAVLAVNLFFGVALWNFSSVLLISPAWFLPFCMRIRPLLEQYGFLIQAVQCALILGMPLVVGLAYATGKLRLRNGVFLMALIPWIPMAWIATVSEGVKHALLLPNMQLFWQQIGQRLTSPFVQRQYFFFSKWVYLELALSAVICLLLPHAVRRWPSGAERRKAARIMMLVLLCVLAVFTLLNCLGVFRSIPAAIIRSLEARLNDGTLTREQFDTRYAAVSQVFYDNSSLMRAQRIGTRLPYLLFCLLTLAVCMGYAARRLRTRDALIALAALFVCVAVPMLLAPTPHYNPLAQLRQVAPAMVGEHAKLLRKLLDLLTFALSSASLFGVAALLRAVAHRKAQPQAECEPAAS